MVDLYFMMFFIIVGALVALEAKDMVSSIIAVGAVGLGVSLVFLTLKAPDLAITQLTAEVLMLIILIRLTIKVDLPFSTSGRWFLNTAIAVVFITVFLAIAYGAVKALPEFGSPTMKIARTYVGEGLARTGATNLVSSIILDFRAYDTLGEATVLLTAVIGVLSITRRIGKRKEGQVSGDDDE